LRVLIPDADLYFSMVRNSLGDHWLVAVVSKLKIECVVFRLME